MAEAKARKGIRKMRMFLMAQNDSGMSVIGTSAEGDISDRTARTMVENAGDGAYIIITGRERKASLSRRTVVDFALE